MTKKKLRFMIIFLMVCLFPLSAWADMDNSLLFQDEVEIPIIMYHFLSNNISNPNQWVIQPEVFEEDLIYIRDAGYNPVFMQDLIDFVYQGIQLPSNPIVITFDDGDSCVHRYALPLLKQYGLKAVVSIIGKPTDMYSADERTDLAYFPNITWDQARELQESGFVEIQNHSYNLHHGNGAARKRGESLAAYSARLSEDVCKMQQRIFEELKVGATTFTFPFGAYSQETPEVLAECGILASLTCNERMNKIQIGNKDCLYDLGRYLRGDTMSTEDFFNKILK